MYAVEADKLSRQVVEERKNRIKNEQLKNMSKISLDDLFSQISQGQIKDLNIIVKADVQGSVEAVKASLEKLSNDEVRVRCIHGGVGGITPVSYTHLGKCWDYHVERILGADLLENLGLIADTVGYLKGMGKEVVFDGEHFFDGYKHNPEYAMACIHAAAGSGADAVYLCDTNGGCFPHEIQEMVEAALVCRSPIGIHTHNDTGMADANTISAIRAGAMGFQATIGGSG